MQGLAGSESSSETGLNRPITEDDSLQVTRGGPIMSFAPHCFDSIAEAPENIPKPKVRHVTSTSSDVSRILVITIPKHQDNSFIKQE